MSDDSLFNDKLLASMYDDKDTARYENGTPVKRFLTDGPGSYTLEVVAVRTGVSESERSFGVNYFVVEFMILDARPGKDVDGVLQPPTHKAGQTIGHVKMLAGRIPIKEALEMAAAVLCMPPAVQIPAADADGVPFHHAGKVMPIVSSRTLSKMAFDDGAAVKGKRVDIDLAGSNGKGKHEGKVFYNTRWSPLDANGERTLYPTALDLVAKMTRAKFEAMSFDKFGNPNAPVRQPDEDTPF